MNVKAHTWFQTRAELLVIHCFCFVGRGGRGRFHRQVGSGEAAVGSRSGLAVVPPGLAGSPAGTDKGSRAHTAGASWGRARGGLSQFGALSSLLFPAASAWLGWPSRVRSLPSRPLSQSGFRAELLRSCQAQCPACFFPMTWVLILTTSCPTR